MPVIERQTELNSKNHDSISYLLSDIEQPNYNKLFNRLSKGKKRCLDIGFRVPVNLFMLYHLHILNFNEFVGIDSASETFCIRDFLRQHSIENDTSPFSGCKTLYEIYLKSVIPDIKSGEPPLIDSEETFKNVFTNLHFKTDMFDYLAGCNNLYSNYPLIYFNKQKHSSFVPNSVPTNVLKK